MAVELILKPIYIVAGLGEHSVLPDGAIINIGGTAGPNFTVDGKPLLFADGSSTDGSSVSVIDFQSVYDRSIGEAFIDFTTGKDFVLQAVNDTQFRFDADTGDVTIGGNLTILGTSNTTINAAISSDRVAIHQTSGNYVPFIMEPRGGVTPTVNVVDIKVAQGGASVFTIGPDGTTYIKNLTVGQINGNDIVTPAEVDVIRNDVSDLTLLINSLSSKAEVDIIRNDLASLESDLSAQLLILEQAINDHLALDVLVKHTGEQISVDTTGLPNITGDNVQEAIESISSTITALTVGSGGSGGYVRAYEHLQLIPNALWTVEHLQNTRRIQITVWDNTDEMIWSDSIKIQDANTVVISFNTAVTGRAILMLF